MCSWGPWDTCTTYHAVRAFASSAMYACSGDWCRAGRGEGVGSVCVPVHCDVRIGEVLARGKVLGKMQAPKLWLYVCVSKGGLPVGIQM